MSWQGDFPGVLAVIKQYMEVNENDFDGSDTNFYSEDDAIDLLEQVAKRLRDLHLVSIADGKLIDIFGLKEKAIRDILDN